MIFDDKFQIIIMKTENDFNATVFASEREREKKKERAKERERENGKKWLSYIFMLFSLSKDDEKFVDFAIVNKIIMKKNGINECCFPIKNFMKTEKWDKFLIIHVLDSKKSVCLRWH